MESENVICPVCSLFLRPGISLTDHLNTHPKQKVIEACVKLAGGRDSETKTTNDNSNDNANLPICNGTVSTIPGNNTVYANFGNLSSNGANHSFIYQQFMSTTATPNVPIAQQIVTVPTMLNSQVMCPPYVYQQQQVIMGHPGPSVVVPKLVELPASTPEGETTVSEENPGGGQLEIVEEEDEEEEKKPEDVEMKEKAEDVVKEDDEVEENLNKSCQTQETTEGGVQTQEGNYPSYESPSFVELEVPPFFMTEFNNPIVLQVEEFDVTTNDRSRDLMNIGNNESEGFHGNREESLSRESANIRADERMPPRGELSGQESNDTSENWVEPPRFDNLSVSYDLIGINNEVNEDDDTPTVSGFREPPISYKCPNCPETFGSSKDRKAHQDEKHRKVKLIKKSRKNNNFDNVFNQFKVENNDELSEKELEGEEEKKIEVKNPIVCTLCDTVLTDANLLKQHQIEAHQISVEDRYKCKTCDTNFPTMSKYTEHLKIHPLECRLCGKYFYRRQNMQLHMKRHYGIKPFKCNMCEQSFITKQKRDEHITIHTGEKPVKCNLCNHTFRRHSNLVQHRNRRHLQLKRKVRDYICFCGQIFHTKRKLAWHKEIHDPKPKSCSYCSEKFIHTASLTRHIRRAHNRRYVPTEERDSENVECPICKKIYLRNNLDTHVRSHHNQKLYVCSVCTKNFSSKWNLKIHEYTHASRTVKPFRCELCKGAFIREVDYVAHMNAHRSVKPYTCNYCGAQFIRKYNCSRHVREHESEKTFACQTCGKTFHRSYYLTDHMKVHTGDRPYICHICGKGSTTKSNHNKHVKIHDEREPVSAEN